MPVIQDETFIESKTVTRDDRGRVAIGSLGDASKYRMSKNSCGQILLTPVVEVPAHEMWLHNNPDALASVHRGLADAAEGRVHNIGSFAKYTEIPIDEE